MVRSLEVRLKKNSDVDILVELDYSKHIGLGFVGMKLDLENRLHKNIDLVLSNSISKQSNASWSKLSK